MGYTLNSAKDARGDEHQYVALFNQRLPEIVAYKKAHGGDLEGAFQKVTGTPWPAGRSVKLSGGQGEMTKDRTVKSVLGKYVAPIAGAVAAPYLLPLLGGGAAGGGYIGAAVGDTAASALGGGAAGAAVGGAAGAGYISKAVGDTAGEALGGGGGSGVLGTLGKYGQQFAGIGDYASEFAGGLASGRRADQESNNRAIAANNLAKVNAAQYNLALPAIRTDQAARGEVLSTMQDAPLTGDPRIDKFAGGGTRPSTIGPNGRAAGSELSRQALTNLMNPTQDRLTPQEIPQTSAGAGENIASGIGIGANVLGLLDKYGKPGAGTAPIPRNQEPIYDAYGNPIQRRT